ncbi:hypothetical protein ASE01_13810 [Nocardioides sp. Root190]|uniref:hypothetical protein n=1 Tax=Nocardioides sp. Root190 TaxID=1736488 RepID=UPI0007008414|nr:hypothetical protein [Nocardioides sp. Root190]KRB76100.1 hypothetical protein ASE01_13810 [Nocardioides sp. Root190]
MSFFANAAEVDCYVGGVLRLAAIDPCLGPQLAEASLNLRLVCSDPPACLTVGLFDPVAVGLSDDPMTVDVELACEADFLDGYFRGRHNLVEALARGEVVARGRVSKVLKLIPVIEQTFPYYRRIIAVKDRAAFTAPGAPS